MVAGVRAASLILFPDPLDSQIHPRMANAFYERWTYLYYDEAQMGLGVFAPHPLNVRGRTSSITHPLSPTSPRTLTASPPSLTPPIHPPTHPPSQPAIRHPLTQCLHAGARSHANLRLPQRLHPKAYTLKPKP